jgi:excisionase family DNA binding protein
MTASPLPSPEPVPLKQLLTATQVAEFLQVSESYIYELAKANLIPCGKVGRLVRFDPAEIEAWWALRKNRRR